MHKQFKNLGRTGVFLLSFVAYAVGAQEDIFSFTDTDGAVHLSNVPDNRQYKLMLAEPHDQADMRRITASPGKPDFDAQKRLLYNPLIAQAADRHGIDPALLHAVISVESGYNPSAVSKRGAKGMMQVMPETARRYGVFDLYDPAQNIDVGARYLTDLMKMFNNDVSLVLAAYNAGENAVIRNGNRIPPYRETVAYVPKVIDYYKKYQSAM